MEKKLNYRDQCLLTAALSAWRDVLCDRHGERERYALSIMHAADVRASRPRPLATPDDNRK
jgi:hypothetical protein